MSQQTTVDDVGIFARLHHEFIEARRTCKKKACMFAKLISGIRRFGEVLFGEFFEPHLAVDGHEDVDHQRNQSLVGADVRGRSFTADVLLAGSEREYEAALAVTIGRLPRKSSRHLAHKLFAGGNDSAIGTS